MLRWLASALLVAACGGNSSDAGTDDGGSDGGACGNDGPVVGDPLECGEEWAVDIPDAWAQWDCGLPMPCPRLRREEDAGACGTPEVSLPSVSNLRCVLEVFRDRTPARVEIQDGEITCDGSGLSTIWTIHILESGIALVEIQDDIYEPNQSWGSRDWGRELAPSEVFEECLAYDNPNELWYCANQWRGPCAEGRHDCTCR